MLLFLYVAAACVTLGESGNYTVTDEVYFDMIIKNHDGPGEDYLGRFVVGLFGESAPVTSLNFKSIAKGYTVGGMKLKYKNTKVHRIVQDFVIQMGDVTVGDGTGGRSIYGETFSDEPFVCSHQAPGYVSMANHGKDTNGSQFFILLVKARWLNNKHVVFGKVVKGMTVIEAIADVPVDADTAVPKKSVKVVDCGVIELDKPYTLTKEEAESSGDINQRHQSDATSSSISD